MDQYLSQIRWIEKERSWIISTLERWVNIHSGSLHAPGLKEILDQLKEVFFPLGGEMKEITLPNHKILTKEGVYSELKLGNVLSISKNPDAPIQVLLTGHMDIAYDANLPLKKCHRKSKDILVGRGTADMKSGLIIMFMALKSLEMSNFADRIGWRILINSDEEIGSPGSSEILEKEAKKHHIGLIFEPPLQDGTLVSARKGSANYTVSVKGVPAHAGREFQKGQNAVTSAARFALAAESLTNFSDDITVNIGYLEGGGPLNIVPDRAQCGINVRVKTTDDFTIIKEKIEKIAEIENNREGIEVILHQSTERPPKRFDKKTKMLFEALRKSADPLGIKINWKKTGGVCDGNTLAGAGLTTIDTLGGVGGNLHTEEEYVSIISIIQRAKLVSRFLMQIAAGEISIN